MTKFKKIAVLTICSSLTAPMFLPLAAIATTYTASEVAAHNTASDCWTIINNKVYDITPYVPLHPGGQNQIISLCGQDGTAAFSGQHPDSYLPIIAPYLLGDLAEETVLVLTSVDVSPASASILTGETQQLTGSPKDQNGDPIAAIVSWSTSNAFVATVSDAGLVTAVATGTATITGTATDGSISVVDTSDITVTAPEPVLTTINVIPLAASIVQGSTQQFSAVALDQNGDPMSPQPTFVWESSNAAVGTINSSGLFSGLTVGTSSISASVGQVSGSAQAAVTAVPEPEPEPALTTINVTPLSTSIVPGLTQQFSATALDQNGDPMVPQPTFAWTSSDTSVGTINDSGLFVAVANGTSTVTASVGQINGVASVNVASTPEPPQPPDQVLTSIKVTPVKTNVITGSVRKFKARAFDQNGAPLLVQPTFVWASTDIAIATIDQNGLATGVAPGGPISISASSGGISGSALLIVKTPGLTGKPPAHANNDRDREHHKHGKKDKENHWDIKHGRYHNKHDDDDDED